MGEHLNEDDARGGGIEKLSDVIRMRKRAVSPARRRAHAQEAVKAGVRENATFSACGATPVCECRPPSGR